MHRKLMNMAYRILVSIPLIYFGMLFIYASIYYQSYYESSLTQVPFDFYSLLVGGILSVVALGTTYVIAHQARQELVQEYKSKIDAFKTDLERYQDQLKEAERAKQALIEARQNQYRNLLAEFLVTQELEPLFNSDLFRDLQGSTQITGVKKLADGYSGAQVYSFYRRGDNVPDILKVDKEGEIKNEYQKFNDHVKGQLLIGPNVCHNYTWGSYAGLEYNLNWHVAGCDHLIFLKMYKECLYENTTPRVDVNTVTQEIIKRLFQELQAPNNWWRPDRLRVPPPINIYQEYYPFTGKFERIDPLVKKRFEWGRTNSGLNIPEWSHYEQAVDTLLSKREWNNRKANRRYLFNIVRANIHGDLNSRNILLEVNPTNHNDIYTIGFVDFSHAGNGLTATQANNFNVEEDKGHITNDFCRLETDIKFYLTDLNDEQELKKAWILECLLLEKRLHLPDWEELQANNEFRHILQEQGLSDDPKWQELTDSRSWTKDNARKFFLAWQSIKAIRDTLRQILENQLPQGGAFSMQPFYLALLQASLKMIYYEDDRFHNADLQKLYLILASALLCKELL